MRELTAAEISQVDGGNMAYDMGYAIGNAVGSAAVSIGNALGSVGGQLKQYAYQRAS